MMYKQKKKKKDRRNVIFFKMEGNAIVEQSDKDERNNECKKI